MSSHRTGRTTLFVSLIILGFLTSPAVAGRPRNAVDLQTVGCDLSDETIAELFRSAGKRVDELLSALESDKPCVSWAAARALSYTLPLQAAGALERWRSRQEQAVLHMPVSIPLGPRDFQRLEQALREYGSGGELAQIPRSNLISAYVFALALDGSPEALQLLERLRKNAATVRSIETDVVGRDVELALQARPRRLMRGKNLEVMLRRNLFFSKDGVVDSLRLLAINERAGRALLSVQTSCGALCSGGYHVVVERTGERWRYALIVLTSLS